MGLELQLQRPEHFSLIWARKLDFQTIVAEKKEEVGKAQYDCDFSGTEMLKQDKAPNGVT